MKESEEPSQNILMMPTISDVSTVEEWRLVAQDIAQRNGSVNYRATIVDWPGLGYSDRPKIDYNADVLEKFLVDFVNSPDGPVKQSGTVMAVVVDVIFCNNFIMRSYSFVTSFYITIVRLKIAIMFMVF